MEWKFDMKYFDETSFYKSESKESGYKYYNLIRGGVFTDGGFLYGVPYKNGKMHKVDDITGVKAENETNTRELDDFNDCTCGVRVRFCTDAETVALRAGLKRKWAFRKMNLYNSSGFDFYQVADGKYCHGTVTGPEEGKQFFEDIIHIKPDYPVQIYLPNYNSVHTFEIGIPDGCWFGEAPGYKVKKPVVFYGNSITQGAAASRSGNSFPNIVSRKLDCDILNYSFSGACKGERKMAQTIAGQDMAAMVIDYTRNARVMEEFRARYPAFYKIIRDAHPAIPIIFLGGFHCPPQYDEVIYQLYESEAKAGRNVFYISQNELLKKEEKFYLSMDGTHYTDMGMFRVAKSIVNILQGRIEE